MRDRIGQMPHRRSVSGECCGACSKLQHIQSKIRQELLEKLYIQEAHTSPASTRRTIHYFAVFLWSWCQQFSR